MIKIVSREDLKRLHRAGIETEEPLSAVQEIIDLVRKKAMKPCVPSHFSLTVPTFKNGK